jgi:hypothetical protein
MPAAAGHMRKRAMPKNAAAAPMLKYKYAQIANNMTFAENKFLASNGIINRHPLFNFLISHKKPDRIVKEVNDEEIDDEGNPENFSVFHEPCEQQ